MLLKIPSLKAGPSILPAKIEERGQKWANTGENTLNTLASTNVYGKGRKKFRDYFDICLMYNI